MLIDRATIFILKLYAGAFKLIFVKIKFNTSKSERIINYMKLIISSPDSNKSPQYNNVKEDETKLFFFFRGLWNVKFLERNEYS